MLKYVCEIRWNTETNFFSMHAEEDSDIWNILNIDAEDFNYFLILNLLGYNIFSVSHGETDISILNAYLDLSVDNKIKIMGDIFKPPVPSLIDPIEARKVVDKFSSLISLFSTQH